MHSGRESGIIRASIQIMRAALRVDLTGPLPLATARAPSRHSTQVQSVRAMTSPSLLPKLSGSLALLAVLSCVARALPAIEPPPDVPDDGPSSKAEIFSAMQDVRRKYGSDAVMLEGHLLGQAVRNGSVGEAAISVGDFEVHDGKRFLAFQLETGIVYNDRELSAAGRPARAWSEIVEASLRKFRGITLPADGIVLRLVYTHREYDDEAELRAHIRDQPGIPETAVFYLLLPDIGEMLGDRISGQQLIDGSMVLVNGVTPHILLAAPTPTAPAVTPGASSR